MLQAFAQPQIFNDVFINGSNEATEQDFSSALEALAPSSTNAGHGKAGLLMVNLAGRDLLTLSPLNRSGPSQPAHPSGQALSQPGAVGDPTLQPLNVNPTEVRFKQLLLRCHLHLASNLQLVR